MRHTPQNISIKMTTPSANTASLNRSMQPKRFVTQSFVTTSEIVLPNDTNLIHNLFGGRMMQWMDIAGAISAQRHSNRAVVTASVDNITFRAPIRIGNVVTLEAQVTRSFNSSMEIRIIAYAEDAATGSRVQANEAFFTFVAVDQNGRPIDVPEAVPVTPEEHTYWEEALQRRHLRLLLAGRLGPEDAERLKALFEAKAQASGKDV